MHDSAEAVITTVPATKAWDALGMWESLSVAWKLCLTVLSLVSSTIFSPLSVLLGLAFVTCFGDTWERAVQDIYKSGSTCLLRLVKLSEVREFEKSFWVSDSVMCRWAGQPWREAELGIWGSLFLESRCSFPADGTALAFCFGERSAGSAACAASCRVLLLPASIPHQRQSGCCGALAVPWRECRSCSLCRELPLKPCKAATGRAQDSAI